jgi:hypothetical protein
MVPLVVMHSLQPCRVIGWYVLGLMAMFEHNRGLGLCDDDPCVALRVGLSFYCWWSSAIVGLAEAYCKGFTCYQRF